MKEKNKTIAKTILKTIGIAGIVAGVVIFPGLVPLLKWIDDFNRENNRAARHSFYRLKKRGMIKVKKEGKRFVVVLTEKGRRQFFDYKLRDFKQLKQPRWDGRWRMVMFDVPEAFHSKRDSVRKKLLSVGFLPIQKSVFINPYPCGDLVELLRSYYRLEPGQLYLFEAKVLEGESVLKKHFRL